MSSTAPLGLGLGLAPLVQWASRHGGTVDPRAAEVVVGLLALSGARRRTGLPEPDAELVTEVMLVLLPLYASAAPAELAGYAAVLTALIGYTQAAGKLNAKRRDRLMAEVETLRPRFESAMTSPRRVTWARLYGQLLRADGVDAADPRAVGAWVDAWAARPDQQRRGVLGLDARGGGKAPLASSAFVQAMIGERSRQARLLLAQRLEFAARREQLLGSGGPPLVTGAPRDETADAWYDAQAGHLADRWTAAGLDALLHGRAAALAPGLDRSAPLLDVVEDLAALHLQMYGPGIPLAPPLLSATAEEVAAAVRAAPLTAALAAAAAAIDPDPGPDPKAGPGPDPEPEPRPRPGPGPGPAHAPLLDLALASGFLRRGAERSLLPGTAADVWRDGTPAELAGLALDVLGALLAQMTQDEEVGEELPGENLLLLYTLSERGGIPESLAWQAAVNEGWIVTPETPAVPDVPAAGGPYQLPDAPVLSQLTGIPGLTEEDRKVLEPEAFRLVRVVDRLAGLGFTTRSGDAIAVTPLGSALLRDALILGTMEVDQDAAAWFPAREEVLSWDAGQLAGVVGNWPEVAARQVLREWLSARGASGWETLLPALSVPSAGDAAWAGGPVLLRLLDLGAAPAEVLRAAVPDAVIGAFAEQALRLRGLPADYAAVPLSARAVLLASELQEIGREAFRAHRLAGTHPGRSPWLPPELKEAFDRTTDGWPGGAPALVAAMAGAAPGPFAFLAGPLSQHPDPDVAPAARRALLTAQPAPPAPRRQKKPSSRPTRSRKSGRHR